MINVVLFEPEIPPNTGNIIRLAANTGASLTLIEPLGFDFSDTRLKRAGLDYHEWADVRRRASLDDYLSEVDVTRVFAFSTRGARSYASARFCADDTLLFGPETRGLPDRVLRLFDDRVLRIPMQANSRSLNLANAVAVGLFEAWRQIGFTGAFDPHTG